MNTYTVKFNGYYPVGACAVISAPTKDRAKIIFEDELRDMGLAQDIPIANYELIATDVERVTIILDGEY